MLNILSWILTGLVVGALARMILPGRQSIGLIGTILLGIVGAFVGGLIGSAIWGDGGIQNLTAQNHVWWWQGWLMSILGGVLVLWLYVTATRSSTRTI